MKAATLRPNAASERDTDNVQQSQNEHGNQFGESLHQEGSDMFKKIMVNVGVHQTNTRPLCSPQHSSDIPVATKKSSFLASSSIAAGVF